MSHFFFGTLSDQWRRCRVLWFLGIRGSSWCSCVGFVAGQTTRHWMDRNWVAARQHVVDRGPALKNQRGLAYTNLAPQFAQLYPFAAIQRTSLIQHPTFPPSADCTS